MRIYFEITVGNILRYNKGVVQPETDDIFFVFDSTYDRPDVHNEIVEFKALSFKELRNAIKKVNPTEIIVNSFRLTDVVVIRIANEIGIPVVYMQHGSYQTYVKREWSFAKQYNKAYRFIRLYFQTFPFNKTVFSYPLALLGIGNREPFSSKYISIDTGYFWSEYWRAWHEKNSWCYCDNTRIVGDPNHKYVNLSFDEACENVLVVSQSLVEDGRLSMANYEKCFAEIYCRIKLNEKTGYVRFHPRQSKAVKQLLLDIGFIDSDSKTVPFCACIGSYSSVLPSIAKSGLPLYLVNFDKEEIPEAFKSIGRTMRIDDLRFTDSHVADPENLKYYWGI